MKNFENLTISDYISMLRRRVWYVVAVTLLITIGTTVYVLQIKPTFTSDTTIFVFGRLVAENYVDSIVRETNQDRIEFVRQQLQTRSFLERVVQEFQFAPAGANMDQVIQSVRARSVLTPLTNNSFRLSFTAGEPELAQRVTRRLAEKVIQLNASFRKERVYGTDQFLDDALRQAGEKLSTAEEKLRRFYNQHFPGLPKDGVSMETVLTLQTQLASSDSQWQTLLDRQKGLERRIEELRQLKTVAKASAPAPAKAASSPADVPPVAVQTALEQKLAAKRSDLSLALTKYTALHPEVIALTQEVKQLEAQVNQERANARSIPPTPVNNNAQPVNSVRNVPAIPLPDMDSADIALAELEIDLDRVKRDIVTAEQAKKQAAAKLALNQARINPPAELAQELATLTRELDIAKQQYADVSSRKSKAGLASEADTSDGNEMFKIVDEANLPPYKNGPRRSIFVAGGFFFGLLLGFGAAIGRELLDSSIQDEAQATAELKIDVLTSIPEVGPAAKRAIANKSDAGGTLGIVPTLSPREGFEQFHMRNAEAGLREVVTDASTAGDQFRLLRSKLSAMQKTVGLKSLIVTSAVPDEGKTFSAACLAGLLAQERNKKVLLIDADLRTGSAGKALGVSRNVKGLTELLSDGSTKSISERSGRERMLEDSSSHYEFETNEATQPDVVQRNLITCSTSPNWYFLPAGAVTTNPAELLSSPGFAAIMRRFAEEFDWVIIDSPPVLAVADANLLTPVCDATLFVVRAGKTSSSLVKDAVKGIGPERICGLILNRVRNLKTNRYYSYYYSRATTS